MNKVGPLLLVLLSLSPLALSQPAATATTASSAAAPANAEVVTLGDSAVGLAGPWKFAPGDSPIVNGAPLWAQPGFDDSKWGPMDLAATSGSVDPAYGTSGFVPGWTKKGFPDLYGYAWYRLRVRVTDPGKPLWIKMPNDFDDAYQLYANGQYVGRFGEFTSHGISTYSARTFSFPLPAPGPSGEIVLAARFYMTSGTRFQALDAGGMHQAPVLGLASVVRLLQNADDDANLHYYAGTIVQALLFVLLVPLAMWAWLQRQHDMTYFWLTLALVIEPVRSVQLLLGNLASLVTLGAGIFWGNVVMNSLILPLWIMFWWSWFGLQRKRWIPRAAWVLGATQMLSLTCLRGPESGFQLVPRAWLPGFNYASVALLGALGIVLVVILFEGFRRDRTEALAAAAPILLLEFSSFTVFFLNLFGFSTTFYPFGIGISAGNIANILMILVIGVLVLRRFVRTQVHESLARQAIRKDLEQAQQLQQRVLVPEKVRSPFFSVEEEYRPAQTVGGDFFQTLTKADGSLLVVIGDVSGKGISAAMLVAVLVGAIRTRADESFDPPSMLTMLNHRLIGRSGGHFATCLVAELSPDGQIRIANAGHLPPYLNGKEMALEGSLPLGLVEGSELSVQAFMLQPGDRLTFMTDGVVEATNEAKELFGFERAREISREHAASIAEQAQSFGQEDDITVVSVSFVGVAATV